METRARYVLVGLFVLVVIAASFSFVYWLHSSGGLGERATYRIRFENTVAGLRAGSAVLFNGMRVGEVTALTLDLAHPKQVIATILVERNTPVRADTRVEVEVQGLMGSPSVSLKGGASGAPSLPATKGEPPLLLADPTAGQDTMQAARDALRHFDKILTDNADPLKSAIANLDTFSGALAKNSDKLDQIVEGLVRMTGGGAKALPTIYDLTAPRTFTGIEKIPAVQLVIADPTTVVAFETQKILVKSTIGEAPTFADAQWSDSIPKLFQARIIQSFENAKYPKVGRSLDGFAADFQLLIDIREFRVLVSPDPVAHVEFGAKVVGQDGRVVHARIFKASAPAKAVDAPAFAAALDEAFGKAVTELVPWTLNAI